MPTCPLTPAEVLAAREAVRSGRTVEIAAWQTRLEALGLYVGIVDGIPGPKTRAAIDAAALAAGILTGTSHRLDLSAMDRGTFYDEVRHHVFGGAISQSQLAGMEHLLAEWQTSGTSDYRHLAYAFATSAWETGRAMQPVAEWGKGRGRPYGATHAPTSAGSRRRVTTSLVYYGRGDVQLTWYDNYARMGALLGVDLAGNPDLALDPAVSKRVLIEGITRGASTRGDFTGRAVEDYIHGRTCDYAGARRTVNGIDHAEAIAAYARHFDRALVAAGAPVLA